MAIRPQTKHIIAAAFEKILETKSFDEISVKDIVESCGASRTAFYHHFHDKYDLATWIHKQMIEDYIKNSPGLVISGSLICQCLQFMKEKQSFFTSIVKYKGQNSFHDFFYDFVLQKTIERIKQANPSEPVSGDFLHSIRFYLTGATYFTLNWVKNGMLESAEGMTRIMLDSLPAKLTPYFAITPLTAIPL
ncbi:MAG: TetR/AcrR family transcriptional regulator [Clostridiales bacterium]|jgi:probable dihydroxyacetone kinase regulator|nr:TetR/AcrR family transcriptional regulator [Clostridiales bacterium]